MAKGHAGGLSRKECESRGTLLEFLERYPDEESCERRLLEEKHPGGFVCPACGNRTCSKVHGHAHKWQCTRCSHQFSVTAGTMMEGTHLELRKWFVAIWLMSSQKAGIAAGLSSFRGLEQKEYDSSDGDASLPMVHRVISNFKAYVEGAFHGLSKKHLQSYADSYSWRYSHRGSSDACMELLHEMCLMHVPLSGIAATATVQPKLPASLPKPFAVQGA